MSMTRRLRSGRGLLEVVGLGAIFALVLGCPGSAQTPAGESVLVDKQVTITFDGKDQLVVEPEVFVARIDGPGVEFVVQGLPAGYKLEIDFKAQKVNGPFLRTAGVRGRYEAVGSGKEVRLPSGKVDAQNVKRSSYWKYEIVVRDSEGNDRVAMDPGGVFR